MIFETFVHLIYLQNIDMFAQGFYQLRLSLEDSKV